VQTPGPETKAKPKAKKLTDRTSAWKALDFEAEDDQKEGEGEEEEEKEDDEEVEDPNDKRDYAKARKFGRLLKNGQVPDDILKMYNDDAMQSKQPRMYRTALINKLFRKDSKGEYIMCHKDPEFLSWKKNLDTSFATEKLWVCLTALCCGRFSKAMSWLCKQHIQEETSMRPKDFGTMPKCLQDEPSKPLMKCS